MKHEPPDNEWGDDANPILPESRAASPCSRAARPNRHFFSRLAAEPETAATSRAVLPFSVAFTFGCALIENESQIAKANGQAPGKRLWIGFSTSQSLGAASTAAASRAMPQVEEILFSYVK